MNKQLAEYAEKIHAMTLRERLLIIVSVVALLIFLWWNFYAGLLLSKKEVINGQNDTLKQDIQTLTITSDSISKRINQGVNKTKQKQLHLLTQELSTVNDILNQMTLELIEPNEMFELMQQLIFADSKLKLTGLKRKQVTPAFTD